MLLSDEKCQCCVCVGYVVEAGAYRESCWLRLIHHLDMQLLLLLEELLGVSYDSAVQSQHVAEHVAVHGRLTSAGCEVSLMVSLPLPLQRIVS